MQQGEAVAVQTAIEKFATLIESKNYIEMKSILQANPGLVHQHTQTCDSPLIMAIKRFDPEAVEIVMSFGADPHECHECKRHQRAQTPFLIAAEEYCHRLKKITAVGGENFDSFEQAYTAILAHMLAEKGFKTGGQ